MAVTPDNPTLAGAEASPTRLSRSAMIISSVFLFWLVGLIDKFAFGTILTDRGFLTDLGLTGHAAILGALASLAVLTQAVGYGVFGWAVDRFGPRPCAIVGVSGWVVSCALGAVAHSVAVMVVSRVLLGLCEGYTWPVGNALTARWFPAGRRARARALWLSAVCVGPGVAGFLTSALLGSLSWRSVFWCLAAISLVLCLPMALFFVKNAPPGGLPARAGLRSHAVREVLRIPRFWVMTIAAAGTTVAVWALASWLPSYLVSYRHTPPSTFRPYVLGAYLLGLVAMLAFSPLVDRLRRRSAILAAGLAVSGVLVLVVGLVPAAPYLVLIAAIVTIIYGVTLLIVQGFQDITTEVHLVGTENGLMNALSNLLAGVVPFAMGWLIDVGGGGYGYAFGFLFGLLAISGVAAIGMHRLGY